MTAALVLCVPALLCGAPSLEQKRQALSGDYPPETYILGVGESRSTGSDIRDFRVAEIMARRDIAQQVRIAISSIELDFACGRNATEGGVDKVDCRDDFISIIQASTSEFLSGSRIIEKGTDGDHVYVIVAMTRMELAAKASEARADAIKDARASMEMAHKGKADAPEEAREAILRAKAYDSQARAMGEIRKDAQDLFMELEAELEKLK